MSIQVDREIVHDDVPPDQPVPKPVPRPRRRLSRKWLISLALILVAVLGAAAFYVFSIYRQQLERVEREIRPIARLEVQAVATNDLRSFLALQDPDDPAWRAMQEKRFGRLEREGLPEFGWKAMGTAPQLGGVPTDARSREELYRAIGTRIVQALVTEASRGHPNLPYLFSRQLLQWELSKAGLAGPFITPEVTRTLTSSLQIGVWQPLSALAFRSRASGPEPTNDELMMPSLALAFLEQYAGGGTVERLIPAMQFNVTLGEGIGAALKVNPRSLEPAWLEYLRKQAGLPAPRPAPPEGELALTCFVGGTGSFSILRIGADGSTIQTVEGQVLSIPQLAWSPDGRWLAVLQEQSGVLVVAPDLAAVRWLDAPGCLGVAWRPGTR